MPQRFQLEAFPNRSLDLFLFHGVTNGAELLSLLRSGTLDPECALLAADLVPGTFPVLAAAHKALANAESGDTKSRTSHSELVFCYSASKHIREGLQRCGVGADTASVLVARFDCSEAEAQKIQGLVHGEEVGIDRLAEHFSMERIRKHFKIVDEELAVSSLEDAITSRIAVRECL